MKEGGAGGLARAIAIAAKAHESQRDRAGAPYILHPLRVMMKMDTDEERTAAVLHDVVEDTDWTMEMLAAEGIPPRVLEAVDRLTKRPGEEDDYPAFIERVKPDPLARKVKIADLEDNMDIRRVREISDKDVERLRKYLKHWLDLRQSEE